MYSPIAANAHHTYQLRIKGAYLSTDKMDNWISALINRHSSSQP